MGAGLSGIIEHIASLERPGGGLIASQAHRQDLVVGFPPLTTVYYRTNPVTTQYAMIVYNFMFGNMTPTAFSYSLNYTGWFVSSGILTQDMLEKNIDFFMVITTANPINVYVTNRDMVEHQWEANWYYLTIGTRDDLDAIAKSVRQKGFQEQYLARIVAALEHNDTSFKPEALPEPLMVS